MIKVLVLLSALLCAVSCLPMFDILHPQRHLASSKKISYIHPVREKTLHNHFRPKHHFNRHWSTLGGWEIIRRPFHPCPRKPARTTTYPPKVTTEAVSRPWSTSQSLITSAGPVYSVNPLTTTAAAPVTASTTTPATPAVTATTTYPPKVTTEAVSRAWSTSQSLITSAAPVDSANPLTTTAAAPVTASTTTPATPAVTTTTTYPPKVTTEAVSRAWSTSQSLITSAAPVDSANPLTTTAAAPVTASTTMPATPVVTTRVTGVISTTEERGDI